MWLAGWGHGFRAAALQLVTPSLRNHTGYLLTSFQRRTPLSSLAHTSLVTCRTPPISLTIGRLVWSGDPETLPQPLTLTFWCLGLVEIVATAFPTYTKG